MFPLRWNFPFRKKDGSITTIGDAINSGGGGGGSYTLPTASADTKGGVKIGVGLTMDGEVLKNTNPTPPTPYELPTASAEVLGGVKVGNNLSISEDGTLNASGGSAYELPTASYSIKGGVKIGEGLISIVNDPNSINDQRLFVRLNYNTKSITSSHLTALGGTFTQVASSNYKILGISVNLNAKSGVTLPEIVCTAHAQKSYNGNYWDVVFKMTPTDGSITDLNDYVATSQSYVGVIFYKESY